MTAIASQTRDNTATSLQIMTHGVVGPPHPVASAALPGANVPIAALRLVVGTSAGLPTCTCKTPVRKWLSAVVFVQVSEGIEAGHCAPPLLQHQAGPFKTCGPSSSILNISMLSPSSRVILGSVNHLAAHDGHPATLSEPQSSAA